MRAFVLLGLVACSGGEADDTTCAYGDDIVVVDIDGTLTPGEDDLSALFLETPEDPPLRDGAVTLLQGYRARGVRAVYLTVQGAGVLTSDGSAMNEAIAGWFRRAGVPYLMDDIVLAEDFGANRPEDERAFKAQALADASARGAVRWAYGDTEVDTEVFAEVTQAFVVGDNLPEEDAFVAHAESHLPTVEDACAER